MSAGVVSVADMARQAEYTRLISLMRDRPLTFCVTTYGCQMNAHDGEKITGMLLAMDMREAPRNDADIVIVNTCCVRENAERRALGNVRFLGRRHVSDPNFLLGVCGCMVQESDDGGEARKVFPEADFLFGTHNLHMLPEIIYNAIITGESRAYVERDADAPVAEGIPAATRHRHRAFVNVIYGCNNFCSYCIVPYVRGRERSRTPESVLNEIEGLRDRGVKEIMLLGQNVNSYGHDLAEPMSFAALLRRIDAVGIKRVRFMTSHPKDLSDELIQAIGECDSVCKHIHLPVQSGSDRILSLMNRGYTRGAYLDKLRRLRRAVPRIGITSDLIVGFPTETEADAEDTLRLVDEAEFDAAYTFIYSKRKGTKAALMDGQIDPETATRRIERLIRAQEANTRRILDEHIGHTYEVLADEVSKRDERHLSGKTDRGISVTFPGGRDKIGEFTSVEITSAGHNTLRGVARKDS